MAHIVSVSKRSYAALTGMIGAARRGIGKDRLPRRMIDMVILHYVLAAALFMGDIWEAPMPKHPAAQLDPSAVTAPTTVPPTPVSRPRVLALRQNETMTVPPLPKARPAAIFKAEIGGDPAGFIDQDMDWQPASAHFSASRAKALESRFHADGYDLARVVSRERPVPGLLLKSLPADWSQSTKGESRKRLFLKVTLPLIMQINAGIQQDRNRLIAIVKAGRADAKDRAWVQNLARRYGCDPDRLLHHVDVIPPSLALAQAALESGWGTSRFAHRGNALFGERTWKSDKVIKPLAVSAGAGFGIRRFDSLLDSVEAYMLNINKLKAYEGFRRQRAALRRQRKPLSGIALAPTLSAYSVERQTYVGKVTAVIDDNRLGRFDRLIASP